MNGGSLLQRLSNGPARVCGLVAGGLGLVVALTAAVPPSGAQHGAAPPHNRSTALGNFLTSVSAVSASDAWAVGNAPGLALHWNGTRWVRTGVPHPSVLNGVSALSASDAWAVGARGLVRTTTLALHWNGTAWTRAPTPSPGKFADLTSVSAASPADAWAVGVMPTLALRWNGTAWTQAVLPHLAGSFLLGVSTLSPSDAWAVGGITAGNTTKTLALHWNGTAWAQVPTPSPGRPPLNDTLSGVSVLSPSDAWAVGASGHGHTPFSPQRTLVLHWNGSHWTQVPAPSPRGTGTSPFTILTSVSARTPSDAWAVGCACTNDADTSLVLHWNGTAWARS